jgi:hypothetical protein
MAPGEQFGVAIRESVRGEGKIRPFLGTPGFLRRTAGVAVLGAAA